MKSDKNGTSTCPPGEENYEMSNVGKHTYVQYDWRHPDGELFSTAAPNLKTARDRRDKWLTKKEGTTPVASDSVKDLMDEACAEIQQLTEDRDGFYKLLKQLSNRYTWTVVPVAVKEFINDQLHEYENRPQRTSACKKLRQSKRVHNRKTRSKQI